MASLEKELARKLAWAVNSTLSPPDVIKARVRLWSWRVACKMVNAKSQFRIDNSLKSDHDELAGGGADGVSDVAKRPNEVPRPPAPLGGAHASTVGKSLGDVRTSRPPRRCLSAEPDCNGGPWSRCRIGRFWGAASSDDRRGWSRDEAPSAPKACTDGG